MNKPISREANIVVQDLGEELLIYDLNVHKAFCLNKTSALVHQFSDGTKTIVEIADAMSVKLGTSVSEDLVWLAVDDLKRNGLLKYDREINEHFAGLSRREVIKKVGLASIVALPMVSSLIAPRAANAASPSGMGIDPNCSACSRNTPTSCQNGGALRLGCDSTSGAACAQAYASDLISRTICCNGPSDFNYNTDNRCCTLSCRP